jgi:glycosyltransferase involved in cell wall biosynthesis
MKNNNQKANWRTIKPGSQRAPKRVDFNSDQNKQTKETETDPRIRRSHNPLVSVVTVTYNSANTLQETIDSVKKQTYENIEHIIIDGGSNDGTIDIIKKNDNNISFWLSEHDDGIYDAMNKGITYAKGYYILMLNSDDWYEPTAIKELVEASNGSDSIVSGALARYIHADNSSNILPSMPFNEATLLRMPLRHQTMLIPARVYLELGGYNTDYSIISDFDYAIRLFRSPFSYIEINKPLLNFRTSGVSNTNWAKLHREHIKLVSRTFDFLDDKEALLLGNHEKAKPSDFLKASLRHINHKEFVSACHELIREFSKIWGGKWKDLYTEDILELLACKQQEPLLSIVIPMHNSASTVEEAIESALASCSMMLEVICIDDKSTDETINIVKSFSNKDSRVKIIINEINSGPGYTRNAGIRNARGRYVAFLDADDLLEAKSLDNPLITALEHDSQIVRSAFRVSRTIFNEYQEKVKYINMGDKKEILCTNLYNHNELLESTEGHWACLYKKEFLLDNLYPEKLRVGEDSLFLIKALSTATRISITQDIVYHYRDNPNSAMNSYNIGKCLDDIEWRGLAWNCLYTRFPSLANYFLFDYWNFEFLQNISSTLTNKETALFADITHKTFQKATRATGMSFRNKDIENLFNKLFLEYVELPGLRDIISRKPKVLILNSLLKGGAAIAAFRMLDAFRKSGIDAFAISIWSDESRHIYQAYLNEGLRHLDSKLPEHSVEIWKAWQKEIHINSKGNELFSSSGCIVDQQKLSEIIDSVDIIYAHWTTGMLDMTSLASLIKEKPLVWTIHDMNLFTGGCHYSEACTRFEHNCEPCHLIENKSQSPHKLLQEKVRELSSIKNLTVVSPSNWLARHARNSAVLRGKTVRVIPNFVDEASFYPRSKLKTRIKLGWDLKKKYILFGADSLSNRRKGGHLFIEAIERLATGPLATEVECVVFGDSDLDLPIDTIKCGFVRDPTQMALLFSASDAFVFPSLEENAPQVIIEAVMCATNIVCFDVGNTIEYVQHNHNGFIANYGCSSSLADGISWVIERSRFNKNENSRELMRHAIAARRRLSRKSILSSHLPLLSEALGIDQQS